MATTTGRVLKVIWQSNFVCVWIGSSITSAAVLNLGFGSADSDFVLERKQQLVAALAAALDSGVSVAATHGNSDSEVIAVELQPANIGVVGPAIHADFFSVTGTGFPGDAVVVFQSGSLQVLVTPEVRRPHWLLVGELPAAVPNGRCLVWVEGAGYNSGSAVINVVSDAHLRRRVLYSGRPATGAYTIAFAATPARSSSGTAVADGILSDRSAFHAHVTHCINNLLNVDESLLRDGNIDRAIRFVAIFDPGQAVSANTALVSELSPNILQPQTTLAGNFASSYGETADIVYCVSSSTIFTRASALWTTDQAFPFIAFTYDGGGRQHGLFAQVPGGVALSTNMDKTGLTALHEFGHAASETSNGRVIDLYVDGSSGGFEINKKFRAKSTDPVPTNFSIFNTTQYTADQSRDGIGYEAASTSYHPSLIVSNRPNLMDNYWLAGGNVLQCRLDTLTYDWCHQRLAAKVGRA